ncbi:MAG TPA: hypothetical protein VMT56_00475 [Candidatus Bathyarchaeia archaeon]|nr:hypothetical protein [Candidatus Bathyarchaeia archaeon]
MTTRLTDAQWDAECDRRDKYREDPPPVYRCPFCDTPVPEAGMECADCQSIDDLAMNEGIYGDEDRHAALMRTLLDIAGVGR